ncbi:hypothetical protein [Desulfomonile tiedjei]|uniref:Uncharacterized protein n=1 Tax=Desulfomonile tiedjei (strain ATCC 49306 / DSM 6799 / DCB-1) TaxID=706587 RepID=I4BZU8_DESTA|nr:hypothetical protein [Desulfomonile tiedjei]AFM22839.1 hypothetical protein Desti_0090 [Desulfomonile tiedjei DSM 6799]
MNKKILYGVAAVVLLLAQTFVMTAYGESDSPASERELCLQNCRQWIGEDRSGGGRGRGIYDSQMRLYARCVERCERKFWKEFDKQIESD